MRGIFVFIFSLIIIGANAQGINFQGVARSANGTILASSNISLRLSVLSKIVDATPEYVEVKKVVTNAQGIFSIVIGDGLTATVGTFSGINWANAPKFLKVEMDPSGGTSYLNMGITQLQYVPYSFYSLGVSADNVTGVLAVEKGGTGVGSLADLKTALKITSIDTTSLSNRINAKMNYSDTASLSKRIDEKLSKTDFVNSTFFDKRENIKIGTSALENSKAGYGNVALGYNSLNLLDSGSNNIAIGSNTLTKMVVGGGGQGSENLAIGSSALQFSTGNGNTALGTQTLQNSTKAYWNVAVGEHVMRALLTGSNNVGIGYAAMINSTGTASNNTIIGYNAGASITSNNNTVVGSSALNQNTSGSENTAFGSESNFSNVSGNQNVAIGSMALRANTTGSNNTALGYSAMSASSTYSNTTAIGYNAQVSGSNQIQLGDANITDVKTSGAITAAGFKVPNGTSAQYLRADGTVTTSVTAGVPYTGASQAVDLGAYDLKVNGLTIGTGSGTSTFTSNTAIGKDALKYNTSSGFNTAIGMYSLLNNTIGRSNTSIGYWALGLNTTGNWNISTGGSSLMQNTTGSNNTAYGSGALWTNITGSNNTALGYSADVASGNLSNSTAIGSGAIVATSNTIQLGNTSVTDVKTSGVITASGIKVGTVTPTTSAVVEINSTTQGFLPPRMTASQRDAISSLVAGLVVWCSNCGNNGELQVYNGNSWTNMIGGTASVVNTPNPPNPVEAAISFSINVDPGVGNILGLTGTSQAMVVTINSTLPSSGVNIQVSVTKDSDNSIIFSNTNTSSSSTNNITITGLTSGVLCTATVTITSRSLSSNTQTKSFKLAAK